MGFNIPEGNYYNTAQNFDNWTNSSDNYDKAINNEQVEEFSMFQSDNLQSYSSDLKQFSQEYINMWDSDGDGAWNKDEFIMMATGGQGMPDGISKELEQQYNDLYNELYENLNIDDNKDSISAAEFATQLYAADMDWENYAKTGKVESSVDGKLDYVTYQSLGSIMKGDAGYDQLQAEKADFYNYFYADKEEVAEQKETKTSKADLPEGFKINDDKQILDKDGKVIGRTDVTFKDITNDGLKDKITEYYLFS